MTFFEGDVLLLGIVLALQTAYVIDGHFLDPPWPF